jgi:MFS family permease
MLIAWSVGATIGPALAGLVMEHAGPRGLFLYLAPIFAAMALFTIWRMMARAEPPRDRRTAFVPAATPPQRLHPARPSAEDPPA